MEPRIIELAETFIRKMDEVLTAEELREVRKLNEIEKFPGVCHTHDFCDANMVMADAFEEVTGQMIDADIGAQAALWSAAWDRAKSKQFAIAGPADSWAGWDAMGYEPEVMQKLLDLGFTDSTWHNDVCPSFTNEGENLRLWVYEFDGSEREHEGEDRFMLIRTDEDGMQLRELCKAETFEWILPAIEKAVK